MRKFIMGLATVALIGAVGCGDNNADNNGTTNGDTNNATNNAPNNEPNNETNNEPNNEPNNETNNEPNNGTNGTNNGTNGTNNGTNGTNNGTNNATPSANCVEYCDQVEANCADEARPGYADRDACLADCETFTDNGTDCATDPSACDAETGDTVQCRVYHAFAAAGDSGLHCPHADGDAPCAD